MSNRLLRLLVPAAAVAAAIMSGNCGSGQPKPVSETSEYRNVFAENGYGEEAVNQKIEECVRQMFYGDPETERIYYETEDGKAYMLDVNNNDIRSEGISYGMMFCVQLDMQEEFDRLWAFAHDIMQYKDGDREGYFAWAVAEDGTILDPNPAPDGEEYLAMALLFASNRWGDREGIYDYRSEANDILDHMIRHRDIVGLPRGSAVTNIIDDRTKQVVFTPYMNTAMFTDPSYHLPHFYELFALWADDHNEIWAEVAGNSRELFRNACHENTGLAPDYAFFDGTPVTSYGTHNRFEYDAWRVAMNITLDSYWWSRDPWQRTDWAPVYMDFFRSRGLEVYPDTYNVDGTDAKGRHSLGLIAMNALPSLITPSEESEDFVQHLWEQEPVKGPLRYFDNCLYLFALLNLSGQYRIIHGNTDK